MDDGLRLDPPRALADRAMPTREAKGYRSDHNVTARARERAERPGADRAPFHVLPDLSGHALIGFAQERPAVRSLQTRGLRFSRAMFALGTDPPRRNPRGLWHWPVPDPPWSTCCQSRAVIAEALRVRFGNLASNAREFAHQPAHARGVRPPGRAVVALCWQ
jgi:hypothetical protein